MVSIRTATVEDADDIAATHIRTWQVAYAHILPAAYLAGLDATRWAASRRSWLAGAPESATTLVAVDGSGAIIGHASVGPARDTGDRDDPHRFEVYSIYVHPDHWSTGAGRALLEAGVGWLIERGAREIWIWVFADNPRARGFYERHGFATDGATARIVVDEGGEHPTEATEVRYARQVR